MKKMRFNLKKRKEIFENILLELKEEGCLVATKKELVKRFEKYGHSLQYIDFKDLKIREILLENGISSRRSTSKTKLTFFNQLLDQLKEEQVSTISNNELISRLKAFGVTLSQNDISELKLREILYDNGIKSTYDQQSKLSIIDKTIEYIIKNRIKIKTIADLHKQTQQFGKISRGTLDNNVDYIQQKLDISNIKSTKKIKALDMDDMDILTEAAKFYIKKGIFKVTASELRAHSHAYYRTINIDYIKKNEELLFLTYGIELIGKGSKNNESINKDLNQVLEYLKTTKKNYHIVESDNISEALDINHDWFIVNSGLKNELSKLWEKYLYIYISWLAEKRINVRNGFLDSDKKIKIDTDNKRFIMLKHSRLNIDAMTFSDFVVLSTLQTSAANKSYGIHRQNMYIGFLFYLYSENKIILPFSYLFDICYSNRKVQEELPFFLANHSINKKLLQYINEKRLNIKDDKYKRIFQFFLLSLPNNYQVESIEYTHLVPLLNRNKSDFKRVVKIFNYLGANILVEKPKEKHTDRYKKYQKIHKYAKLLELFNKTMNRAYKLGSYSKEENVYKDWSTQYASFFDFIEDNYSNENISESFLYSILNYPDEENFLTYQEYILEQNLSSNTKTKRFTPLVMAFSENTLYPSLKNLKNKIPVFESTNQNSTKKQNRAPITNPIILEKLEDILINRPPKSDYHNNEITVLEKHKKWWKHFGRVAPFEPLILLAHLYIPARGINFRLADCDSFLVKDENDKTTGYHFTHDKNKKRKTPYVAPNIWGNQLEIIEELTRYVKFHFPNLQRIKYDKQNPNGILPLFPNKEGTNFYSDGQHMKYWKRVLLKAQIELNNENNEENILLIFPTSDFEIPKNSEDVDKLSQGEMEKLQVKYDLHSLRHTGATKYANAGMPLGLLALLTGHIDTNVLQSVYIELNAQKMIEMWNNIQDIDIGGSTLAEAGKKFIHHVETIAKETLQENSPEKLLKFLEEGNFISIGSYLNKDELTLYELEDFAKIDPVFWSFRRYGICTSAQCPQGLENRCSLCPHFMTSPAYIQEVVAHINLQNFRLSKYGNMIIENRKKGNPQDNENIRKSAQIEMEEMLGWIKVLQALDEVRLMVDESVDITNSYNKDLTIQDMKKMSIFSLAPIVNSDHSLLKLVYDSLELKEFEHESFHDVSEKLVSKIIRYAARNNCFEEIDGVEKYQILEWFKPVYYEVLSLERDDKQKDKLEHILNLLSDKPSTNLISSKEVILLESKEEK